MTHKHLHDPRSASVVLRAHPDPAAHIQDLLEILEAAQQVAWNPTADIYGDLPPNVTALADRIYTFREKLLDEDAQASD